MFFLIFFEEAEQGTQHSSWDKCSKMVRLVEVKPIVL